jgi:BioD-like phosphotransacetylase family protein
MNTVTKRLFIAATQQNDGKTTVSLGIFGALRKTQGRIGFIKPVGQRFVEIEGHKIDEDTVLIDQTYGIGSPLDAISPIAVEPEFTRRFIQQANTDVLVRRIQNAASSSRPIRMCSSGAFRTRSIAPRGKRTS